MNSLAPDWCNASPDATHYVIHADGAAEWPGMSRIEIGKLQNLIEDALYAVQEAL